MTPREIELSHAWQVWHRAQWQDYLRMMLVYRGKGLFELAALSAERSEWHVHASRAHARLVEKRVAP